MIVQMVFEQIQLTALRTCFQGCIIILLRCLFFLNFAFRSITIFLEIEPMMQHSFRIKDFRALWKIYVEDWKIFNNQQKRIAK